MSRYRKAVAAFVTAILALPLAKYIAGTEVADVTTVAEAIMTGLLGAFTVWRVPNQGA